MTTTATKRTKVPAKRTAPAEPIAEVEAPEGDATPAEQTAPGTITFHGRVMKVNKPTPDQLGMWTVTSDQMTKIAAAVTADTATDEAAIAERGRKLGKLFSRAFKLVASVLVDEDDQDWIQDEVTDGNLTLEQTADILLLTVKAYGMDKPAAPTTGPRPKARRGQ